MFKFNNKDTGTMPTCYCRLGNVLNTTLKSQCDRPSDELASEFGI